MKHELPELGYEYDALEPFIDAKTMEIHHKKHHQAYIDKLNAALEKHSEICEDIFELLKDTSKIPEDIRQAVINNGGGHVNHSFFWKILAKDKKFSGKIKEEIEKEFGNFDNFKIKFKESALGRFGSGWTWLVLNKDKKLEIISTGNQDSPLSIGFIPVLGLDVWEHAYYLKYQNRRADYVDAFWNVINWEQVDKNYADALNSFS
jgi:Fe-Mn family superoxide dismutase